MSASFWEVGQLALFEHPIGDPRILAVQSDDDEPLDQRRRLLAVPDRPPQHAKRPDQDRQEGNDDGRTVHNHIFDHFVILDHFDNFCYGSVLMIDVDFDFPATEFECFVKRGHLLRFSQGQLLDFSKGQILDVSLAVGRPVDAAVVHQDQNAVTGTADVDFNVIAAQLDRL